MQGVFINGSRPASKKALKEAARITPESIVLEATSMFGGEFGGCVMEMPEAQPTYVVGPDPYTSRKWYATIARHGDKITIT